MINQALTRASKILGWPADGLAWRRQARLCALLLSLFTLFAATCSAAQPDGHGAYLVDARIHVALIDRTDSPSGTLLWHDTVTGRTGEAGFTREGSRLLLEPSAGGRPEVMVLPDLAIVVRHPPWGGSDPQHLALGHVLD